MASFLKLNSGDYLLQTDGIGKILLEATASLILAATININLNCNITISAGRAQ